MDLLRSIFECFGGGQSDSVSFYSVDDKHKNSEPHRIKPTNEKQLTSSILSILFTAEKPGREREASIQDIVHTDGWYEGLAKSVLDGLVAALQSGQAMGGAIKEAYDKASAIASEFAREHPVLAAAILTVVAIGILVYLAPWVIEALGFGELGPVEGSVAAFWQSTFPDVEAGSWFSWFQRLGMKWGKKA